MKVLALDMSTTRFGWALGEPGKVESSGFWIRPKDLKEDVDIFIFFAKKVAEKAIEGKAIYCVAEDWVKSGFPTQMLRSAALRGGIMVHLKFTTVIDMIFTAPSEWRKYSGLDLTGLPRKGRSKILKERAMALCEELKIDVENHDQAEAALILVAMENLIETEDTP